MYIPSEWRKKVQIKTGPRERASLKDASISMVKKLYNLEVNDD